MSGDVYFFPIRELGHIKVDTVYKIFYPVGCKLGRSDIGTHTLRVLKKSILYAL